VKNSLLKLLFELIGTIFFTILFIMKAPQEGLLFGLWVLMVFGYKISGSHYNPAITFAVIFRRDGKTFHPLLGACYIIFQVAGGFLGALLGWFFMGGPTGGSIEFAWKYLAQAIVSEIAGSFVFILFFLIMTDPATAFSKEKAINCFIIAATYVSARTMMATFSEEIFNPAIGIGISFTQLFAVGIEGFSKIWVYAAFPLVGSILAVLFHEYVYKRTCVLL
jgi:aquaporin Z